LIRTSKISLIFMRDNRYRSALFCGHVGWGAQCVPAEHHREEQFILSDNNINCE